MENCSSTVGAKFQITLPKKVRQRLGISKPGGLVGFMMDGSRIVLTKAEIAPEGDSFTEEEWSKLVSLARSAPKKTYSSKEYRERLKKLTGG